MAESPMTFLAAASYLLFASFPVFGDVTGSANDTVPGVFDSLTSDYVTSGYETSSYYVTSLLPSALPSLFLNQLELVQFIVSSRNPESFNVTTLTLECPRGSWSVIVRSLDPQTALPVLHQDLQRSNRKSAGADARFHGVFTDSVVVNDSRGYFGVLGRRLGRCMLAVEARRYPRASGKDGCPGTGALRHDYHVTVVRLRRSVDVGFNWAVATTTVVNGFSLGCVTEWRVVKECSRRPGLLLLAASLQLVAMPIVALALVRVLSLGRDLGMGLLCVACLPGGGMAYVIAALTNRKERNIDAALNFISVYASTATFPLWIFLIDRSTARPPQSTSFSSLQLALCSAWLAIHAAFHQTGFQLRLRLNASHVDSFLNWLTKPFLLLYAILLTTLGIYINAYTIALLSWSLLAAITLLPTVGFLLGTGLGALTGQRADVVRVLAAETATTNSALALTVMRFTLDAPESDTMVTVPFWLAFTSPVPVLIDGLLRSLAEAFRVREKRAKEGSEEDGGVERNLRRASEGSSEGIGTATESCVSPLQLTPVEETHQQQLIVRQKITVL